MPFDHCRTTEEEVRRIEEDAKLAKQDEQAQPPSRFCKDDHERESIALDSLREDQKHGRGLRAPRDRMTVSGLVATGDFGGKQAIC